MIQKTDFSLVFRTASIIAVITAFYWQDLTTIFSSAWHNSELSYLLVVPILALYLCYRKRKVINAIVRIEPQEHGLTRKRFPLVIGILLCATAVFLYFYASMTFSPLEYHIITLPVFASGLILIFFNFTTLRALAFPLTFLLFLTPPTATVFYSLSSLLSDISAHASAAIVSAFGMHSTVAYFGGSPNIIMTKGAVTVATFIVDFTCSGINGLITFAVFTVFLAYLVRDKLWKKVSLVAIGFPLIYSMNILRISSVLAIGFHYGTETAESLFHTFSGLILTFFGALLLALIAQKALKANFYGSSVSPCATCASSQTQGETFCTSCGRVLRKAKAKITGADIKKIAAIASIVATLMVIQAPIYALARTQTDLLEQVHQGQTPSTNILPQINDYTLNFSFEDKGFEVENQEDAALTYSYTPNNSSAYTVWVVLEIATSADTMHDWETCLISYPLSQGHQAQATQLDLYDAPIMQNPPITARVFAFHWTEYNVTQTVLYWRESLIFASNSSVVLKNVQINLSVYPNSPTQIPQAETQLMKVAKNVDSYWEPIKTWTPIALLLSQDANILAALTTIGMVFAISFYYIANLKNKTVKTTYSKLSEEDKKVLAALYVTQRRTVATVGNIAITFRKLNNQQIEDAEVDARLDGLAGLGLVSPHIRNVHDNPILAWKSNAKKLRSYASF